MSTFKVSNAQCRAIILDPRNTEEIAMQYGISSSYAREIKAGKARQEARAKLTDFQFETIAWEDRKAKYIKTRRRVDKSKTADQHEAVFLEHNPKPLKTDFQ